MGLLVGGCGNEGGGRKWMVVRDGDLGKNKEKLINVISIFLGQF